MSHEWPDRGDVEMDEPLLNHGVYSDDDRVSTSDVASSTKGSLRTFSRLTVHDTHNEKGLTHAEAAKRLIHFGPNQVRRERVDASRDDSSTTDSILNTLRKELTSPVSLLIMFCLALQSVTCVFDVFADVENGNLLTDDADDSVVNKSFLENGKVKFGAGGAAFDVLLLTSLLLVNARLVVRYRRGALQALCSTRASLLEPINSEITRQKARVIRDGEPPRIVDSKELVPGDLIMLGKKDTVQADVLVTKQSGDFVYSVSGDAERQSSTTLPYGAVVVSGDATAVVVRTGSKISFVSGDAFITDAEFFSSDVTGDSAGNKPESSHLLGNGNLLIIASVFTSFVVFVVLYATVGDDPRDVTSDGASDTVPSEDENKEFQGVSFFAALSIAAALTVATVPVSARAIHWVIKKQTVTMLGSVKTSLSRQALKNSKHLDLASIDAVVIDSEILHQKTKTPTVAEIRVASTSPGVGPRDVLTCAALSGSWGDLGGDIDKTKDSYRVTDQAVHTALGGTKALNETYKLVSERIFSMQSDESASTSGRECLIERKGDGSHFRVRRGEPVLTLQACDADEETTAELLIASEQCERAGLRCVVVAAHHGATDDDENEIEKDCGSCASSAAFGWTVLGLVAIDVPLRNDMYGTLTQLRDLWVQVVIATNASHAGAGEISRRAFYDGLEQDENCSDGNSRVLAEFDLPVFEPIRPFDVTDTQMHAVQHACALANANSQSVRSLVATLKHLRRGSGRKVAIAVSVENKSNCFHLSMTECDVSLMVGVGGNGNGNGISTTTTPDLTSSVPGLAGVVGAICESRRSVSTQKFATYFQTKVSVSVLLFYAIACLCTTPDAFAEDWPHIYRVPTTALLLTAVMIYLLSVAVVLLVPFAPSRSPQGKVEDAENELLVCFISAVVSGLGSLLFLGALLRVGAGGDGSGNSRDGSYYTHWLSLFPPLMYGQVICLTWLEVNCSIMFTALFSAFKNNGVPKKSTVTFLFFFFGLFLSVNLFALYWPYNTANSASTSMHRVEFKHVRCVWTFTLAWFVVVLFAGGITGNAMRKVRLGSGNDTYPLTADSNYKYASKTLSWTEQARVRRDVVDAFQDGEGDERKEESKQARKKKKSSRRHAKKKYVDLESGDQLVTRDQTDQPDLIDLGMPLTPVTLSLLNRERRSDGGIQSGNFEAENIPSDFIGRWVADQAHAEVPYSELEFSQSEYESDSIHRERGNVVVPRINREDPDADLAAAAAEAAVPLSHRLRTNQSYVRVTYEYRANILKSNDWLDTFNRLYAERVENGSLDDKRDKSLSILDVGCGSGGFAVGLKEFLMDSDTKIKNIKVDLLELSPRALIATAGAIQPHVPTGTLHCASLNEFTKGTDHLQYNCVFAVNATHALSPGVGSENSLASFLKQFQALIKQPFGFGFLCVPTADSHESKFFGMYRKEFGPGSAFAAARLGTSSNWIENGNDKNKNKDLVTAEHVSAALTARGVPHTRVDRAYSVVVHAGDDSDNVSNRNDSNARSVLETYLYACAGDDLVRVETMLTNPRIGAYLNSVRTRDGSSYVFPVKTAHITL